MLSYIELRRTVGILEPELSGSRVQRTVQVDDFSLALNVRGGSRDHVVLLNCRPEFARVSIVPEMPETPPPTHTLGQYVRAHLSRVDFQGIALAQANRQVSIRLEATGGIFELILSILGARSNIYILDGQGNLVHSMRPLEETRRELVLGGPWKDPEGSLPSEGFDRWPELSGLPYIEEMERTYRRLEYARQFETLARKLDTVLNREATFLGRKAANLLEDLREAREAEEYRHKGEILKGALHLIEAGDESVTLPDFESRKKVVITLDPALTPAQNLEAYFHRYRKEQRSVAAIEEQMASVQKAQAAIETLLIELRALTAMPEPGMVTLQEFADRPRLRQLLARHVPRQKLKPPVKKAVGKSEIPGRLRPKRYRTASGLEIWVGRSDESNDYLTTRLARGNDLFFHLEGYPGSHVILRTEGRTDPPADSVLSACELAVHFSKMKEAGRADVHVAHVKDVKKPKGAKPGLVYVTRGKTIHLRRDPKRLEDVLASRLDE